MNHIILVKPYDSFGDMTQTVKFTGYVLIKGAILDLHFGQEGEHIFTASSDNTVGMFDYATGTRLKRMKGHHGIVNAVHAARRGDPLICSASDDATIKIWDSRRRNRS